MAQSVIGALRVNLALGTAAFEDGAKKAGKITSQLAERIKRHSRTIKLAFAAAGAAVAAFAAGMTLAIRGTLSEMDRLTKLSRSVGVPVEQLSALQHAAELSGISVEELGRAFRNVARNAQGAARAPTDFSRSLDALGVSWRKANGQFIRADQLMLAVADQFAQMKDGAGKTALAMKIFGEEMGPRMVSLLNAGSASIRQMTAEAEQLGLTISEKTGTQAEAFNDNIDRLGKQFSGFVNRVTANILPVLNALAQAFVDLGNDSQIAEKGARAISFVFKSLSSVIVTAIARFRQIVVAAKATYDSIAAIFNDDEIATITKEAGERILQIERRAAAQRLEIWRENRDARAALLGDNTELRSLSQDPGTPLRDAPVVAPGADDITARTAAKAGETEQQRLLNEQLAIAKGLVAETRTPYEELTAQTEALRLAQEKGAITAEEQGRAHARAAMIAQNAYATMASGIIGSLQEAFGQSKAIAIAQALINSYQSFTNAMANIPAPFNIPAAASALAAGFAQVANIRKTTKNSGGSGDRNAGTGAAGSGGTQRAPRITTINLQGESFGRDQVFALIEQLNAASADGAEIRIGGR